MESRLTGTQQCLLSKEIVAGVCCDAEFWETNDGSILDGCLVDEALDFLDVGCAVSYYN